MKSKSPKDLRSDKYERFLALYSINQKRIFSFILALVPKRVDAEDVLQQTMLEMWRLFDRFEAGTNFSAWGMKIARFQILKFRRQQQKKGALFFPNDQTFQVLLDQANHTPPKKDYRLPALEGCIKKLQEKERHLLNMRYEKGLTYQVLAEKTHHSLTGMYKIMAKIHTKLQRCIHMTVSLWEY